MAADQREVLYLYLTTVNYAALTYPATLPALEKRSLVIVSITFKNGLAFFIK